MYAAPLPPELVDQAAEEGCEYRPAQETRKEEHGDIDVVRQVQRVHVRALHPISQHDYEVEHCG